MLLFSIVCVSLMMSSPMVLVQVLHPQSMRPAREADIPVRVKNSYNPQAPGTLITKERDLSKVCSFFLILCLLFANFLVGRVDISEMNLIFCM